MNQELPGRTDNDRRGAGKNRDGTRNNRDFTVAPPGPIQTSAELRQHPGCRWWCPGGTPLNSGKVPV
ncbi:hypothetical protein DPMN_008475 [Dreissena polymorpha]|uniref:Uncharacterized protein n=1 Tax=Dreissena polymorpha TaxID=45954 RepID=A0A9D4MZB8_DREPO|nr:hypothetical protein DPMN_008475 [Dreissena polymorpha]